jgi:small nuclear ribonucleoprotein (snRNP)-like protein
MKTLRLLLIFTSLIIINKVAAQNIPSKQKLGIVTYTKQSKIIDTATFNKTSSIFAKNMVDSLKSQMITLKTKLGEDTSGINAATAPFENLMLEEVFKTETSEIHIDEFQKDKIVSFVIENEGNKTEKFYFNYTDNLVYNSYNSEEIEDYFKGEGIISLTEYRTATKLIKGYNCFKVTYVYREQADNEEFQVPEMIIERELWVTDKIIAPFHSIIRSQQILSKYYPLEITEKMSKVNGFETKYLVENISLK